VSVLVCNGKISIHNFFRSGCTASARGVGGAGTCRYKILCVTTAAATEYSNQPGEMVAGCSLAAATTITTSRTTLPVASRRECCLGTHKIYYNDIINSARYVCG